MANLADLSLNDTMDEGSGIRRKKLDPAPAPGPISPEAYVFPNGAPPPPQPGNPETPRDRAPEQGPGRLPLPNQPGPYDQSGTTPITPNVQAAPARPMDPSPVSMQPFAPMAPPQGVQRKVITGGPAPGSALLGRAGGLMGGGLGVPTTTQGVTPDVSALIAQLIQRRG